MNNPSHHLKSAHGLLSPGRRRLPLISLSIILLLSTAGVVLAQAANTPDTPPESLSGRVVFNENCLACHGPLAMGDGEAAGELAPNVPAALAGAEYLRTAIPAEMYRVISEGRIENLMPPFGLGTENVDPIPEAGRWNVIAYIFSLGTPVESIEQGQIVYDENCLACHGEQGTGDGPESGQLTSDPGDLSDVSYWSNTSNQNAFEVLVGGSGIVDHQFTVGEDGLSEEEIRSVVDYLRTFSYVWIDALEATRPLPSVTVGGQVINGTTGEPLDEVNDIRLWGFTGDMSTLDIDLTLTMTGTVGTDGSYSFDLTDVPRDLQFMSFLSYEGLEYFGFPGRLNPAESELQLPPITVYDSTADPADVDIASLHIFLSLLEEQLIVTELYVVSNHGDTVYTGQPGGDPEGTFTLSVPSDVDGFAVDPPDFVNISGSNAAYSLGVRPGEESLDLMVEYVLPYGEEATISHPIHYTADQVNVFIEDVGVSIAGGDDWLDRGVQNMGGGDMLMYGKSDVPAGTILTLNLEGEPQLSGSSSAGVIADNQTELLIGAAAALVMIGVAAVFVQRWRREPVEGIAYAEHDRGELLQAIAELDDDFEAGLVSAESYHRKREELKTELMALWEEDRRN